VIRLPRWAAAGVLALLGLLLIVVAPRMLDDAVARFGVVGVALLLFFPAVAAPAVAARAGDGGTPLTALASLAIPLVLMWTVVSADERHLRLVPAAAWLGVAAFFHASLRTGGSLAELAVRALIPTAPEFIRGYCRGLTLFWAGFFAVAAGVIGWAALAGHAGLWRLATGRGIVVAILAVMPFEFLLRKSLFRYYYFGGPFDRFWSRLFPPEATERGRASQAYIEKRRAELRDRARAAGQPQP